MSGGRFEFHEPKARALLARALRRYGGAQPGGESWETLELKPGWDPRRMYSDEMSFAEDLVAAAAAAGAVTGPAATEIHLICLPDSDGGQYMWRVRVPAADFTLASGLMEEARRLGDGSKGVRGALSVIREAAGAGNQILSAYEQAAERSAAGSLLASIREIEQPDGSWPGGDVVPLLTGWFADRGLSTDQGEDRQ